MPVYQLNDTDYLFPNPNESESEGLLAIGGDLSPKRLLYAYINGIFPWYNENPILWWSPDPRMILYPSKFHCSKSLKRVLKSNKFNVRFDSVFSRVIDACAKTPHNEQTDTWINNDMRKAYKELYKLGFAHSVETFIGNRLVGGIYGVSIGGCFFGESMFHADTDASKVAFYALCKWLTEKGFGLVDCQMHTPHLESLGAESISRDEYLELLKTHLHSRETWLGKWV